MKLGELRPAKGARRRPKRAGRGIGSGLGKTAGRGHKGQKARAGGGVRPGFEGGQMPLQRRLPKRGFNNRFKTDWTELNIERLNEFEDGSVVTPETLAERGLIKKSLGDGLVILGNGELKKALTVKAHRFTRSAEEKIKAAGGKAEVI